MARSTHIYGLYDKRDGIVRYVGQTRATPSQRLAGHRDSARKATTPGARWVASIGPENVDAVVRDYEERCLEVIAGARRDLGAEDWRTRLRAARFFRDAERHRAA